MAMKPLENRPNSGVLFHRQVENGSKRPDLSGGINVNGTEFELAGWSRTSKNGREYISLTIKPVRDAAEDRWQP